MILYRDIGKRPQSTRIYPMQTVPDSASKRVSARNRFLAACSLAGAATTAYRNQSAGKISDEASWIDVARLGSPDAPSVLVLACGLSGDEGFCGSTIMTEWLASGHQRDIPHDVGLIMLHAILPSTFSASAAAAPAKTRQRSWSDNVLSAAARRFASYAERTGKKAVDKTAPTHSEPAETAWMEVASNAIVDDVIEHAHSVALLEFHTGLRPYGEIAIASCYPESSDASARLKSWFGDAVETEDPAILDLFALGFGQRLMDLSLTAAHVEFGVYTMGGILSLDARKTKAARRADVRSLFTPDSEAWEDHIRTEGNRIVGHALAGLAGGDIGAPHR